jgi:hypothetical protein
MVRLGSDGAARGNSLQREDLFGAFDLLYNRLVRSGCKSPRLLRSGVSCRPLREARQTIEGAAGDGRSFISASLGRGEATATRRL